MRRGQGALDKADLIPLIAVAADRLLKQFRPMLADDFLDHRVRALLPATPFRRQRQHGRNAPTADQRMNADGRDVGIGRSEPPTAHVDFQVREVKLLKPRPTLYRRPPLRYGIHGFLMARHAHACPNAFRGDFRAVIVRWSPEEASANFAAQTTDIVGPVGKAASHAVGGNLIAAERVTGAGIPVMLVLFRCTRH